MMHCNQTKRGVKFMPLALVLTIGAVILCGFAVRRRRL